MTVLGVVAGKEPLGEHGRSDRILFASEVTAVKAVSWVDDQGDPPRDPLLATL